MVEIKEVTSKSDRKIFVEFNDLTYEKMKKIKLQTDISGPSKFVDLNFEESLKQRSK